MEQAHNPRMKPFSSALVALAMLNACPAIATDTTMDAGLARLNQPIALGPLRVTPIAVLEDERCVENPPESCPYLSSAIVRLLVEQEGKKAWLDIPLGGMKRWGDHAIAIAGIKPKRRNRSPIPSAAYQISLRRIPADVRILE